MNTAILATFSATLFPDIVESVNTLQYIISHITSIHALCIHGHNVSAHLTAHSIVEVRARAQISDIQLCDDVDIVVGHTVHNATIRCMQRMRRNDL